MILIINLSTKFSTPQAVTAGFRKASGFLKNVSAFKQKDFGVLMKTPKSFFIFCLP